jgi:hypothetical protein
MNFFFNKVFKKLYIAWMVSNMRKTGTILYKKLDFITSGCILKMKVEKYRPTQVVYQFIWASQNPKVLV